MNQKYCRIINNEVVEFNIPERQILARNDGSDYRKQIETVKPIEDENNKAVPVFTIQEDSVIVGYELQQRSEKEKLNFIKSIKTMKIRILKENFNRTLQEGETFSETIQKKIDSRLIDLNNIASLIKILPEGVTTPFRCADNSFVEVTLQQLQLMEKEIIQYGLNLYQQKWQLEQQIENAQTLQELRNLDISFGLK